MTTLIPGDSELPIGQNGRFATSWRRWLEAVNRAINAGNTDATALAAEVDALAATVAAIPTTSATIRGKDSITVEGTLASGTVTIGYAGTSTNYPAVMARVSLRC